ncbi:hypothetical protein, partial [Moorena sp. SIO3H5]|uniref:hypothetical protein n=1 Tax=Moorena sp. SIO3H5 TaxID=2607834 RepID=UPI0025D0042B
MGADSMVLPGGKAPQKVNPLTQERSMPGIIRGTSDSEPCMKVSPHTAPRYPLLSECSSVSVDG